MTREHFLKIYDIVKSMKSKYIAIIKNSIIGYDTLVDVKVVNTDSSISEYPLYLSLEQLSALASSDANEIDITKLKQSNVSIRLYNKIIQDGILIPRPVTTEVKNIKNDEVFAEILTAKSSEGLKMYRLDSNHILSIFTGLIPVNKPDKLDLQIININNKCFLVKYIIHKKKWDIEQYILHMYLKEQKYIQPITFLL